MAGIGANWSPWSSNLTKSTPAAGATLLPPPNPANANVTNVGPRNAASYAAGQVATRLVRAGLP